MFSLRQYILSVASAAVICAVVQQLSDKKGAVQSILRIVTGLFLMFTVLQPLVDIRLTGIADVAYGFTDDAQTAVYAGKKYSHEAISSIIKDRTEAYILDKAAQFNAQLDVQITLSNDDIPKPIGVLIQGAISPYGKQSMKELIDNDLGIPEEAQLWI